MVGESRGNGGDVVGVRLELGRERDPGVHRDAVPVVDVQTRDAVDRRNRQRQFLRGWGRLRVEIRDHQRLSTVGFGALGRDDGPFGPLALDATRQRLGSPGTYAQVTRAAPDNLVDRRER